MEKDDNKAAFKTNEQIAMRASTMTIIVNVMLSIIKLLGGILGHSGALVSDAVHSLSDVFSTVIVMIGVKLAGKESDKEHPYGHERFECVAAIILAVSLFATAAGIGWAGLSNVIQGHYEDLAVPSGFALVAAVISLFACEGMYWYKRAAAKKTDSSVLMADAWHHRSDALSSVGSFIGILGALLGFPIMDSLASIVICLFIFKVAYDVFTDAIGKMTDKTAGDAVEAEINAKILAQENVKGIDLLKTRMFGNRIYVDVDIIVDGTMSLNDAHEIAQQVHDAIETEFPKVKHCTVHVNPETTTPPQYMR